MTEEQKNAAVKGMELFIQERRKYKELVKEGKITQEELQQKTVELRLLYLTANSQFGTGKD